MNIIILSERVFMYIYLQHKGMVKVKVTLQPAMKAQKGNTLSLTSVLDGMGGERYATPALRAGKRGGTHLKRLGGAQCLCGAVRKISLHPPPEFDPWTVQPLAHDGIPQLNYAIIWNIVMLCIRADNVTAKGRQLIEFNKWILYFFFMFLVNGIMYSCYRETSAVYLFIFSMTRL